MWLQVYIWTRERGGRNVKENDIGIHGEERNWEEFVRAYIPKVLSTKVRILGNAFIGLNIDASSLGEEKVVM